MARCAQCGARILARGIRRGEVRYCNAHCEARTRARACDALLPAKLIDERVHVIHRGRCPKCGGLGPVDVHCSYQVSSYIHHSSWRTNVRVCCRSCATRDQLFHAFACFLVGWWSIPGLVLTPLQIVRNLAGMFSGPNPLEPSEPHKAHTRAALGAELVTTGQAPIPRPQIDLSLAMTKDPDGSLR